MKKFLILILLLQGIPTSSCIFDSKYGLTAIESPSGEKFYFRREVRGLNYDSLSLSTSSDYCSEPDPSNAFIFHIIQPTVFYKFEGNELHLYTTAPTETPPNFSDKTKVIQHDLNNPEFLAMSENYKDRGLEIIEPPIDKSLFCLF